VWTIRSSAAAPSLEPSPSPSVRPTCEGGKREASHPRAQEGGAVGRARRAGSRRHASRGVRAFKALIRYVPSFANTHSRLDSIGSDLAARATLHLPSPPLSRCLLPHRCLHRRRRTTTNTMSSATLGAVARQHSSLRAPFPLAFRTRFPIHTRLPV
jgi:hypothetical protein